MNVTAHSAQGRREGQREICIAAQPVNRSPASIMQGQPCRKLLPRSESSRAALQAALPNPKIQGGGPPGPRGCPWTRSSLGINPLRNVRGRRGGRPRTRRSAPQSHAGILIFSPAPCPGLDSSTRSAFSERARRFKLAGPSCSISNSSRL